MNLQPEYCFIPFGTGDLFANILKIVKRESLDPYDQDRRLNADIDLAKLTKCNFIGATTNNPASKLEKLFSYFSNELPSFAKHKRILNGFKEDGYIGKGSDIGYVDEKFVEPALKIARENQINCEPSGIAGLALLLQMRNHVNSNKRIVIVNTGLTDLYPQAPRSPKK